MVLPLLLQAAHRQSHPPRSKRSHIHHIYSLSLSLRHQSAPFEEIPGAVLLECLLVQFVQKIQTLQGFSKLQIDRALISLAD